MGKHRDVIEAEEERDNARAELLIVGRNLAESGTCEHLAHALVENFAAAVVEYLRGEIALESLVARKARGDG